MAASSTTIYKQCSRISKVQADINHFMNPTRKRNTTNKTTANVKTWFQNEGELRPQLGLHNYNTFIHVS